MLITVASISYVGLSNGILLVQHHDVVALDPIQEKVDLLNYKIPTLVDKDIEHYLKNKKVKL